MSDNVKKRPLPFGGGRSRSKGWSYNASTQKYDPNPAFESDLKVPSDIGSQSTTSERHAWPPPKGSRGDIGGNFHMIKQKGVQPNTFQINHFESPVSPIWGVPLSRFETRFQLRCPIERNSQGKPMWPTAYSSTQSRLNTQGATAVSRCKPTSSAAELSVAVGELVREGLPSLVGHSTWRERTLRARNAGDEYLNVQFGWAPLVDEVRNLGSAVINRDRILEQYRADRGNTIRRQYSFPEEREVTELYLGKANPEGISLTSGSVPSVQGDWVKKTTRVRNTWFSGAFVYGVPNSIYSGGDTSKWLAEADKLVGLSLTPDTLWNLAPWSWAADWFSNTGDVLSTLSDFISQGLVMQYGYLMEHSVHKVEYSLTGAVVNGKSASVAPATLTTEVKQRVRANPFGFGLTWDGLSLFQSSILAALGISRA